MASTTSKRKAADEAPKADAKKARTEKENKVADVPEDDDDEPAIDPDELEALDSSNIIEGGRRTRGKKIDYSKVEGADEEDDDDEEDEEEGEEGEDDEPDAEDAEDEQAEVEAEEEAEEEVAAKNGKKGEDEEEDEDEE